MNPEEAKEFKHGVDATLTLLMDFRRALDGLGRVVTEPDVLCSHCGQVFDTVTKVMKHGRVCAKNPLVKEIERMRGKVQAILDECQTDSDEQDTVYFVDECKLYEILEGD